MYVNAYWYHFCYFYYSTPLHWYCPCTSGDSMRQVTPTRVFKLHFKLQMSLGLINMQVTDHYSLVPCPKFRLHFIFTISSKINIQAHTNTKQTTSRRKLYNWQRGYLPNQSPHQKEHLKRFLPPNKLKQSEYLS